jgi:hypothetical protein
MRGFGMPRAATFMMWWMAPAVTILPAGRTRYLRFLWTKSALDDAAGECVLVHQYQHIQRVAVLGTCLRDIAKALTVYTSYPSRVVTNRFFNGGLNRRFFIEPPNNVLLPLCRL